MPDEFIFDGTFGIFNVYFPEVGRKSWKRRDGDEFFLEDVVVVEAAILVERNLIQPATVNH